MIKKLQPFIENLPEPIGKTLAIVPFSWRLGSRYSIVQREIAAFSKLSQTEQEYFVLDKLKRIVEYAFSAIPFYRDLYASNRYFPEKLRTLEHFQDVPVVTRSHLQETALEKRTCRVPGCVLGNTGGSSGEPLKFYRDKETVSVEWAHMHHMWSTVGYGYRDLCLTFRGANLGHVPLKYNPVHNEYVVNAYLPYDKIIEVILKNGRKKAPVFLHGYPSALYDFTKYALEHSKEVIVLIKSRLKGVLLCSEYPALPYRQIIDETYGVPSLSWYGHSECAVLAYESAPYIYRPFHTYGYAESREDEEGSHHLIATSYYNKCSPFIRYDMGDLIEPVEQGNFLNAFKISSGRVGDFITDENGKRISLTALIFGRHHKIFNWAKFVQVYQEKPGQATIVVAVPEAALSQYTSDSIARDFDSSNIAMTFDYVLRMKPVRTRAGKVPLLILNHVDYEISKEEDCIQ